ncbi:exo-rhamnogalacturonan lyase family protein [Nonomuraea aurantiaca]|uniref:exo-rhamnogalacturonan lyase family protein n=1 Tax=Nonomuraea aurantiaca TaxID=2878562 RepID=UPI001CD9A334|nr:Tat pathway signal sequence domain protein [Nonomuraea aurantiaca]MCA2222244.1 Tat pathway signal sequence domain protein [Nonomuraea aurantiaca]
MTTLNWLDHPKEQGVTWGVPWARGTVERDSPFALTDPEGRAVPVQSWVTATWPDGSVKWSAHAIAPQARPAASYELTVARPAADQGELTAAQPGADQDNAAGVNAAGLPERSVTVVREDGVLRVSTGPVTWTIEEAGDTLARSVSHGSREIARDVRLVSLHQDGPTPDEGGTVTREQATGIVREVTVEQDGPVRAVVRLTGDHGGRLPFTVRLYFYAGAEDVRVMHTFVWDGDPERDFLAGLGLRADVVMRDELHDRHVRLAGQDGFLTEAVRGLTGLRRDPGEDVRRAQVEGRPCGPIGNPEVADRLHLIPAWNDYTLDQTSADGFTLRKRTADGHAWVTVPSGTRSAGYGYLGGASGGLGFGLRDFWRLHPARLDVRGAATDLATATVWLWSPSAPAMDLRFYHDGMGQDTFAEQLEGLEITYEDYEPGFGHAQGIARTHELTLRVHDATPSSKSLAGHADAMNEPALLAAAPERVREAGVFGDWALPDRSTPARAEIEDRLDLLFDFYRREWEQRRWYGFWDYGDVMHTYDADRHTWRYDVGGYAWDNSELSPDLWLWYQYLRTGRADVFRFAEAMTRHTGEVDVYHLGRWKGLGTRHNVQHWGCSAKQLRISNAAYRRFLYYLTADERTGDLLDELARPEETFLVIDPTRKVREDVYTPDPSALAVGLGTDWGALAAAWLTRWERYGDEHAKDRLLGTMAGIGALPRGFLTGEARFDLATGRFDTSRDQISVSHLSSVFGLPEMCSELIALDLDVPGFEQAWLDYCRLYLASAERQAAEVGRPLSGISLVQAHSRLAAYAAARSGDAGLADLAWRKFFLDEGDQLNRNPLQREPDWRLTRVEGPHVLAHVLEAPFVSTNDAAQYGLAAIQNLALIGDHLPGD